MKMYEVRIRNMVTGKWRTVIVEAQNKQAAMKKANEKHKISFESVEGAVEL